jgi:hypothetical protein
MAWTVHPVKERPRLGLLVGGIILAMSVASWLWTRSGFWPLFCLLVLFLSLESFFFPTRFTLEDGKLIVHRRFSRNEREWSIFRRCQVDRDGMTLSPYRKPTFMDGYRSIRIRWGSVDREQVVAFVRPRLVTDVEWMQDQNWKPDATAA